MTIASISGLQKNRAVQLVDSQLENNDSRHKYFDILHLCSLINKTTSLKTSKFRQNVIKSLAQRRRLTDFFFQVVKMRSSSVFFYFPIEFIQNLMRIKILKSFKMRFHQFHSPSIKLRPCSNHEVSVFSL